MARPTCCRRIAGEPPCCIFKPAGVRAADLNYVRLSLDEFEAIRLADRDGMYQEHAAEQMGVSRQTFGRIIASGRKKVAEALVEGKAVQIEGGSIVMTDKRQFACIECNHQWALAHGVARPQCCPECGCTDIHRVHDEGKPAGAGHGGAKRRRRRACCHHAAGRGRGERASTPQKEIEQ